MKKLIGIVAASSLAIAAFSAPAMAKNPNTAVPGEANCFGLVHATVVNTGGVSGLENVGQAIKALGGGQAKNAFAKQACTVVIPD